MKLFQQMLVAPAALGLMAPMAVTAAELNINEVSSYDAASVEAQSFSDVHPSDWAFKALTELADRHGCAVATPNGSISRYEAAALLNKCLSNVSQVNEQEKLLLNEFGPEIAVLKGRVDGLEARIGEFEAGQFSSTTTMSGKAAFFIGSVDQDVSSGDKNDATTMNYSYQLNMNTSFTGDDLLYTRIKTGNTTKNSDPFATASNGTYLSANKEGDDTLKVDKIWYQFPVGDNLKFWVGPKVENYYMLASAPSIYKPVMKQFALGGNGTVYGSSTQPGFGAAWIQSTDDPSDGRFAISIAYTNDGGDDSEKDNGLFGDGQHSKSLVKVEYGTPKWQASVAVANTNAGDGIAAWTDGYYATNDVTHRTPGSDETAIGFRGYYRPDETGLIPEISAGIDTSTIDGSAGGMVTETLGWMVGLGWKDLFVDGNKAGVAFGQRVHGTEFKGGGAPSDHAEDTFSWEAYYTFQVTDGVSVTPALFGNNEPSVSGLDNNGVVVLTEFKF